MSEEKRGAPEGNGNAVKHDLFSDREKLFNRLSDAEQRLVVDISTDLLKKCSEEIGAYEREAIRNIAVDAVKRNRANEYIMAEDLIKSDSEGAEKANKAYSRLVRDTTRELEKLGLLDDGPAMTQAENTGSWMDAVSDAKDDVGASRDESETSVPGNESSIHDDVEDDE